VTIDNLDEIKINDDILPVIVIKNKSHQLITDKNKKRLSSGEQRCFNILRLILEYESLKTNDKLIIILDDIVDSFDYKNKYSILEYIDEIANSSTNVQLFCLTHNFDFFRNCSNLFKENSKFLFGNNKNGNVELREAKQD
jgi:ABC-type molybdenum transport system ATPase subunit/photorepair protein PhrA